jgi:ADP-heptose:LPS heptosyltransferase
MIGSSAFWTTAIVLTVLAFMFFLRERNLAASGQTWRKWWTAVRQWWHSLWHNLTGQIESAAQALQSRRRQHPARKPRQHRSGRRLIRLNALSPRDQLRYFYLSTVERAGRQGVKRQKSETPLEYAQDLKENWPDAEIDVENLTDAFLQARYSPQPIEIEQVNPIKVHWKKLRGQLRRRQRHQK